MTDDSSTQPNANADGSDDSLDERVQRLARRLEATAELPIDREANRWLGEADAIAGDLASSDLDDGTVRERVETVARLLSEIDATGHEDGDAHLEAAERLCAAILGDGEATDR